MIKFLISAAFWVVALVTRRRLFETQRLLEEIRYTLNIEKHEWRDSYSYPIPIIFAGTKFTWLPEMTQLWFTVMSDRIN